MLLRLTPRRDDRAALTFADLASGLDAGLTPAQLGGHTDHGERVLHELLAARDVALEPVEDAVLAAAWQAGRAPASLRDLAEHRRRRAGFARTVLGRMAYPLAVVLLANVAAAITGLLLPVLVATAAGAALLAVALRGLSRGARPWLDLPVAGAWARDTAELPFLAALHDLYASGVPLRDAYEPAAAAYGIAAGRRRLLASATVLQGGQPLAAALAAAGVLHHETLQLLRTGEESGDLEDALERALQRRRVLAEQATTTLARLLGTAVYVIAAALAIYVIFAFYADLFGQLRR